MKNKFTNDFIAPAKLTSLQFVSRSSNRPGVAMIIFTPFFSFLTSSLTVVPPTNNTCFRLFILSRNFSSTLLIWVANSLVGEITIAPISTFFHFSGLFCKRKRFLNYLAILNIYNVMKCIQLSELVNGIQNLCV